MLHIIYHPEYLNYSFGPGHPFWPQRAKIFLELIKRQKRFAYTLHTPAKAMRQDLELAHTREYLDRVMQLAKTRGALSIDTPVSEGILDAAYYCAGGTELASRLALEGKRVINLLGGLHHAGKNNASGFCIFNDHAIAIKKLQKQKKIKTAFVFDIDVHAGQGTQEIFYDDPTVFTLSIHQDPRTIYPGVGFPNETGNGKGKGFNRNIILAPGSGEAEFLQAVREGLSLHAEFNANFTVLVLGADTYKGDPLADIKLELESYQTLGRLFSKIKRMCVLCAGGYSKKVPEIWLAFLDGFLER